MIPLPKPIAAALSLLITLSACGGETATLSFDLVFPPGTDRLPAEAVTARVTLTGDPPTVVEGPIAVDGSFSLALEVPADGTSATLTFEALDSTGAVLVRGISPPLPLALYQDTLRLFVAPPGRFSEAPVSLDPPRSELALAPLPYGFVIAGGATAVDQQDDSMAVYSAYVHELTDGEDLPEPRAGQVAAAGQLGLVYLIGGVGPDGPSGDILRLDTNAAPDGEYAAFDLSLYTRGGEAAGLGNDVFIVTVPGDVARRLNVALEELEQLGEPTRGTQSATLTIDAEGHLVVVLLGPDGGAIYDDNVLPEMTDDAILPLDLTPGTDELRAGHAAVRLPDGNVLAIGGTAATGNVVDTALRVTPAGVAFAIPLLATARHAPAAAITGDLLVVAGGFDLLGQPIGDAELFDATTLESRGVVPLVVPRGRAQALTLPNGDVVLLGGTDADAAGAPIGAIELFTP